MRYVRIILSFPFRDMVRTSGTYGIGENRMENSWAVAMVILGRGGNGGESWEAGGDRNGGMGSYEVSWLKVCNSNREFEVWTQKFSSAAYIYTSISVGPTYQ